MVNCGWASQLKSFLKSNPWVINFLKISKMWVWNDKNNFTYHFQLSWVSYVYNINFEV